MPKCHPIMPETLSPLYFYGEFLANYSYTFIFRANFTRFFCRV